MGIIDDETRIDYQALIEKRGVSRDEILRRKQAYVLSEYAKNLETLQGLAQAEAHETGPSSSRAFALKSPNK